MTHRTAVQAALEAASKMPRDQAQIIERSLRDGASAATMVKGFRQINNLPLPNKYTELSNQRLAMHAAFQVEELEEFFMDAFGIEIQVKYFVEGEEKDTIEQAIEDSPQDFDPIGAIDAAGDSIYFWHGMFQEMGLPLQVAFREQHGSNMTKMGADGKPIINGVTPGYREPDALHEGSSADSGFNPKYPVGKVLKGQNYMKPQLETVLAPYFETTELAPGERDEIFEERRNGNGGIHG